MCREDKFALRSASLRCEENMTLCVDPQTDQRHSAVFLLEHFNSLKTFLKTCLLYSISRAADRKELNFKILVKGKMLVSTMQASGENCGLVAFCFSLENRLRILVVLHWNISNMYDFILSCPVFFTEEERGTLETFENWDLRLGEIPEPWVSTVTQTYIVHL